MEIKGIEELRLPPKKHSFKVKSLTMLLCALGIGKRMDNVLITNHKIKIFQLEVPPQTLRLEVFLHHQMTP